MKTTKKRVTHFLEPYVELKWQVHIECMPLIDKFSLCLGEKTQKITQAYISYNQINALNVATHKDTQNSLSLVSLLSHTRKHSLCE